MSMVHGPQSIVVLAWWWPAGAVVVVVVVGVLNGAQGTDCDSGLGNPGLAGNTCTP